MLTGYYTGTTLKCTVILLHIYYNCLRTRVPTKPTDSSIVWKEGLNLKIINVRTIEETKDKENIICPLDLTAVVQICNSHDCSNRTGAEFSWTFVSDPDV